MTGDNLASARGLITRFLSGELDEDSHPEIFKDDVLMFAVGALEREDPDWVLGQLADRGWPVDRRIEVLGPMMLRYAEGYEILRPEAPERLRDLRDPRGHR